MNQRHSKNYIIFYSSGTRPGWRWIEYRRESQNAKQKDDVKKEGQEQVTRERGETPVEIQKVCKERKEFRR